ncbi:MAG: hypothetical protein EBX41_03165 [Chitinophagia bacterium]|nr:hypothetical protein [Chitinophagia bacterium]
MKKLLSLLTASMLLVLPVWGQKGGKAKPAGGAKKGATAAATTAQKSAMTSRIALIMGNDNYKIPRFVLQNCKKDADMMVDALQKCGFKILYCANADRNTMIKKISEFAKQLPNYDVALVYYSGHGAVLDNVQYMMPTDVISPYQEENGGELEFKNSAVDIESTVLAEFNKRQNKINFLILDACRTNFNDDKRIVGSKAPDMVEESKSKFDQHTGTTIIYTTGFRHRSFEGMYTEELVKRLPYSPKDYKLMLNEVTAAVLDKQEKMNIKGLQQPQISEGNYKEFCFSINAKNIVIEPEDTGQVVRTVNVNNPKPDPVKTNVNTNNTAVISTPSDKTQPSYNDMKFIEGGIFEMGSNTNQADEAPAHKVQVGAFHIAATEVTFGEFRQFMNETGYTTDAEKAGSSWVLKDAKWVQQDGITWKCDAAGNKRTNTEVNQPVLHVSFNDAIAFCQWLNKKTGKQYRLPTEAEWEYAALGGINHTETKYAGSNEINEVGWYNANSGGTTHTVKMGKKPNIIGIYDLSGNVAEWCSDWYSDDYYRKSDKVNPAGPAKGGSRVIRGGSWLSESDKCRAAARDYAPANYSSHTVGFRLVLP